MTLQELFEAIDTLTPEDLEVLESHIQQLQQQQIETKIQKIQAALEVLGEGWTPEELEKFDWAVNFKYIKSSNKVDWQE
jgi:hypothetical protein